MAAGFFAAGPASPQGLIPIPYAGDPVTITFSNPQVLTTNGVEWIQDPNYGIYLIH